MSSPKRAMDLVKAAEAAIETLTVEAAEKLLADPAVVFVDVRDVRELAREGKMPGAYHAPRGMLEFWIDPTSPYHKSVFDPAKTFVFFCAAGWRSALAAQTAKEMGLDDARHIAGGFTAWRDAGAPVDGPSDS
ncbi:MAG: rhodanese-like domain-containing protein [Pseudomonadota bacterium]